MINKKLYRILYIDPVGEKPAVQSAIKEYLLRYSDPEHVEIDITCLDFGPHALESYFYLSLIEADVLRKVKKAEKDGYDAAIIGCFCDPALNSAKEICERMVVVGVMEPAVHIAAQLAPRFSILAASRVSIDDFRANLSKYGLTEKLASFRTLDVPVVELMRDPSVTERRMKEEISKAIQEDRAEAIVLGCTLQFGHFLELQKEFGVPVIDPILAGLRGAEYLISLRDSFNWYTSKVCTYSGTKVQEMKEWGMIENYKLEGLF